MIVFVYVQSGRRRKKAEALTGKWLELMNFTAAPPRRPPPSLAREIKLLCQKLDMMSDPELNTAVRRLQTFCFDMLYVCFGVDDSLG